MVARADCGMIRRKVGPDEVSMNATPDNTLADPEQAIADLRRQLAEREAERDEREAELAQCKAERDEALARQTAAAEVLQVINSSPGDLAPVFDAILEKAHKLCDVASGSLELFEGDTTRAVAVRGLSDVFASFVRQRRPLSNPVTQPLLAGAPFNQITNVTDVTQLWRSHSEGIRTALFVPLRRKQSPLVGMIALNRREVRPFTDNQIALLQNFAAQAVIAMENARLLTETREALDQQTATAEVLQVINASPGDLTPVFDAILEKACAVCRFVRGTLNVYDGENFRAVATHGIPEPFAEVLRQPRRTGSPARLLEGDRIVPIIDVTAERPVDDPVYRGAIEAGDRTVIFVPLRYEQRLLGYITANRLEVQPFSEKEIALLENFAARRRSSRWRTRGSSPRRARHWSNRPRPRRCWGSSMIRPVTSSRYSKRS
jgi:GAF domain-containing protein